MPFYQIYKPTAVAEVSFESRVCLEMNPRLVKIEVCLRFKDINLRMDQVGEVVLEEYTTHRTIGQSNVCFDFGDESIGLSTAANLSNKIHGWLPELVPSDCDRVSQDIVQYARQVALSGGGEGGAIVVGACIEANKETHVKVGRKVQDYPSYIVSQSDLPRGLSLGEVNEFKQFEINELKQDTFKSGDEKTLVCSVCLEELLAGVKIIQLQCLHSFHHSCITSWLEKQASCPVCRLDIIKARNNSGRTTLLVLDDTAIFTVLDSRRVTPLDQNDIGMFLGDVEQDICSIGRL